MRGQTILMNDGACAVNGPKHCNFVSSCALLLDLLHHESYIYAGHKLARYFDARVPQDKLILT